MFREQKCSMGSGILPGESDQTPLQHSFPSSFRSPCSILLVLDRSCPHLTTSFPLNALSWDAAAARAPAEADAEVQRRLAPPPKEELHQAGRGRCMAGCQENIDNGCRRRHPHKGSTSPSLPLCGIPRNQLFSSSDDVIDDRLSTG